MSVQDTTEATRACLYSVVDRFNTEDPFWSAFVPDADSTMLENDRFALTLRGRGVCLDVRGILIRDIDEPSRLTPELVVGARTPSESVAPATWHPITCTVDANGRFITSNFRLAIEASIDDLRISARA